MPLFLLIPQVSNLTLIHPLSQFHYDKKVKQALACYRLEFPCLIRFLSPRCSVRLVANANKVVGELLDGVGGRTGLDALGVVGDEDGLVGLDDDHAFPAL